MPYLSSIGISRAMSGWVASAIPLASIGGRIGFGWFGDKIDKRWVTAGTFAMIGLGILCFAYASSERTWLLVPFLFLFGISYAGTTALRGPLVREYFGRSNFGTILGFIMGISAIGIIAGPPLAGWVFDNWGSYQAIWLVFVGVAIVALIIIATMPRAGTPS
jgi:MFS family permease